MKIGLGAGAHMEHNDLKVSNGGDAEKRSSIPSSFTSRPTRMPRQLGLGSSPSLYCAETRDVNRVCSRANLQSNERTIQPSNCST